MSLWVLCRFYHNTFEDSFRQECVDLLVGQHRLSGGQGLYDAGGPPDRQKLPSSAKRMTKEFLHSRPSGGPLKSPSLRRRPEPQLSSQADDTAPSRTNSSASSSSSKEGGEAPHVPLRIWIGTWNVAGREVHEWDNLEDWLTPVKEQADIFVFCVQELVSNHRHSTLSSLLLLLLLLHWRQRDQLGGRQPSSFSPRRSGCSFISLVRSNGAA